MQLKLINCLLLESVYNDCTPVPYHFDPVVLVLMGIFHDSGNVFNTKVRAITPRDIQLVKTVLPEAGKISCF